MATSQECPDCNKRVSGDRCPCGYVFAHAPRPVDTARWLCRRRPEGEPCRQDGCDHPGSTVGADRPTRAQVRALVATLADKMGWA